MSAASELASRGIIASEESRLLGIYFINLAGGRRISRGVANNLNELEVSFGLIVIFIGFLVAVASIVRREYIMKALMCAEAENYCV